jgi:hypothetical protein
MSCDIDQVSFDTSTLFVASLTAIVKLGTTLERRRIVFGPRHRFGPQRTDGCFAARIAARFIGAELGDAESFVGRCGQLVVVGMVGHTASGSKRDASRDAMRAAAGRTREALRKRNRATCLWVGRDTNAVVLPAIRQDATVQHRCNGRADAMQDAAGRGARQRAKCPRQRPLLRMSNLPGVCGPTRRGGIALRCGDDGSGVPVPRRL